jgi:hypothetical protein
MLSVEPGSQRFQLWNAVSNTSLVSAGIDPSVTADQAERPPHLVQVGRAVRALRHVFIEPCPVLWREFPLQELGHELHELTAREGSAPGPPCPPFSVR